MELIITKLLVAFLLGVGRFGFGILPIFVVNLIVKWEENADSNDGNFRRHIAEFILISIQSFGGGVLFATCFIHMIPEVRTSMSALRKYWNENQQTIDFPFAELFISIGFFMVYFIEEFSHWFLQKADKASRVASAACLINQDSTSDDTTNIDSGKTNTDNNNKLNRNKSEQKTDPKHHIIADTNDCISTAVTLSGKQKLLSTNTADQTTSIESQNRINRISNKRSIQVTEEQKYSKYSNSNQNSYHNENKLNQKIDYYKNDKLNKETADTDFDNLSTSGYYSGDLESEVISDNSANASKRDSMNSEITRNISSMSSKKSEIDSFDDIQPNYAKLINQKLYDDTINSKKSKQGANFPTKIANELLLFRSTEPKNPSTKSALFGRRLHLLNTPKINYLYDLNITQNFSNLTSEMSKKPQDTDHQKKQDVPYTVPSHDNRKLSILSVISLSDNLESYGETCSFVDRNGNNENIMNQSQIATKKKTESQLRACIIILALSVHAVFEGITMGLHSNSGDIWYLFTAVSIHGATILYCMGFEMVMTNVDYKSILIYMLITAAASPAGIIIGILINLKSETNTPSKAAAIVCLEGLSAGTILYITFFEMLNREKNRRKHRLYRSFCILAGFCLMVFLQVVL